MGTEVEQMGRLIDADVLKKDLTRFYDGEVVARKLIDEQPTVDAVPVRHGWWDMMSCHDVNQREMRYRCSRCHHDTITHGSVPWERYCPMCGARMDGKGNGDETD